MSQNKEDEDMADSEEDTIEPTQTRKSLRGHKPKDFGMYYTGSLDESDHQPLQPLPITPLTIRNRSKALPNCQGDSMYNFLVK